MKPPPNGVKSIFSTLGDTGDWMSLWVPPPPYSTSLVLHISGIFIWYNKYYIFLRGLCVLFIFIIVIALAFISLTAFTGVQLYSWLSVLSNKISPALVGILYSIMVISTIVFFVLARVPSLNIPKTIIRIDNFMMGLIVYLILFTLAAKIILLICRLIRVLPHPVPSQVSLWTGAIVVLLVAGLSIYGAINSTFIKTKSYTVEIPKKESTIDSLKVALISDIHLGHTIGEDHVKKAVDKINSLNPDIVFISGDVFDGNYNALANPDKVANLLGSINSKYGVYASLGNHDAGGTFNEMLSFLESANIKVLIDEAVVIDNKFTLVGRRDSSPIGESGEKRIALEKINIGKDLPVIVMDHQPSNIAEYVNGEDLILSGHTHNGQMFPFNLVTSALFDVSYGYYRKSSDSPQVIVSSGVGTWGPPQRVASNCEVVDISINFTK